MADVNHVFLIGRLTVDPRTNQTPGGASVCTLPLAMNRSYTTKAGEKREEATFVDVVAWNQLAESCATYLGKGSLVHVEGRLKQETWDDRNTGEKRSKIIVLADRVQFLDRIKGGPEKDATRPLDSRQAVNQEFQPAKPGGYEPVDPDEDEIPFAFVDPAFNGFNDSGDPVPH